MIDMSNFGSTSFNAKGGELILVSSTYGRRGAGTVHASILINGIRCGQTSTNQHERAYETMWAAASCVSRAAEGVNTVNASSTSRLLVISN